jgi:DNA polymerase (family X)
MTEKIDKYTNAQVADVFNAIADLLEIKGEVVFKVLAYRKAAESLQVLGRDIYDIWQAGQLNEIPGVGKAIAEKTSELLSTGKLGFLEKLKEEVPITLRELLVVPDVGPRKAALFWKEAGITDLAGLEAAARGGKLRSLPGMGEKSEGRIILGIEALRRRSGRIPLGKAWPAAQELLAWLRAQPGVTAAEPAGSLRRMRGTIGDLDLVAAASDSRPIMEAFTHLPSIQQVSGSGDAKTSVELRNGLRVQLWIQPPERFGALWIYATGSKDHNVRLRELALSKGLSLSEQRLLREDGKEIECATEEEVYQRLGLPWIPPELREDRGEVQAALGGRLPELVSMDDMRADLHSHSNWSDGQVSILEMARAARQAGLKVLAITDHSGGLGITGGPAAADLPRQRAEIEAAQRQVGDSLRILQGSEVEIRADGTLDYPDEALASLDIVIASLHTSLRQPRDQVTQRLLGVIRNPHVDVIGHPTGRLYPDREGADLDMEAVLAAAAQNGVAMEINADPWRLDLDDVHARRAIELGVKLTINRDAHATEHVGRLEFGVATARRGWVTPEWVVNTWSDERLLAWLQKRGKQDA